MKPEKQTKKKPPQKNGKRRARRAGFAFPAKAPPPVGGEPWGGDAQVTSRSPEGWVAPKGHSLAPPRHLQRVSLVFSYESFTHTHKALLSLSAKECDTLAHTLTLWGHKQPKKNNQKTQITNPKNTPKNMDWKQKVSRWCCFLLLSFFLYDADILGFVVISKGIKHLIFWWDKERWKMITHYLKSSNDCPFLFLPNRLKLNVHNVKMIFSQLANHQLFLSRQICNNKKDVLHMFTQRNLKPDKYYYWFLLN